MKLSSIVLAIIATFAFTADCAFAAAGGKAIGMTSGGGNKGVAATDQTPSCPTGQKWDAATKKCVAPSSINYNASKSNTGNVTATPAATTTSSPPPK